MTVRDAATLERLGAVRQHQRDIARLADDVYRDDVWTPFSGFRLPNPNGRLARPSYGASPATPVFGGTARDGAPEQRWHLPKATWLTYLQD